MTTIPSRLAQTTYISRSIEEARRRSTALYRNFYRSVSVHAHDDAVRRDSDADLQTQMQAPEICALYALDVPPSTLRAKFRTQFEKNKAIKDVAVLDVMLLKAQQEYQETMNGWKQVPHIMKWFADEEVSARSVPIPIADICQSVLPKLTRSCTLLVHAHRHPHDPKASWKSSTPRETRVVDLSVRASKPFEWPASLRSPVSSKPQQCKFTTERRTSGMIVYSAQVPTPSASRRHEGSRGKHVGAMERRRECVWRGRLGSSS